MPHERKKHLHLYAAAFFAVLAAAVFADALFSGAVRAALPYYSEAFRVVLAPKLFAAKEVLSGRFPFWNPLLQCGYPFFVLPESGVFYPVNALYALFPPAIALNLNATINLVLAGFTVYLWRSLRGVSFTASVVSGAVFALGAPQFLYAALGSYSNMNTIVWAPLVLIGVDCMVQRRYFRGMLVGAAGIVLQIFVGHTQFLCYTGIAAAFYLAANLIAARVPAAQWARAGMSFAAMYAAGCLLAAAQLLPLFLAIAGSIRSSGATFEFARTFSFPPENFLTLAAPGIFGDNVNYPYWGQWYFWEVTMTIGVSGLFLAAVAAACGEGKSRTVLLPAAAACAVLAMGVYTPFFRFAYDFIPGFSFLRGIAKFGVFVTLFLAAMAGDGLEAMIKAGRNGSGDGREDAGCRPSLFFSRAAIAGYAWVVVLLVLATLIKTPFSRDVSGMWDAVVGMFSPEKRWPFFVNYHETLDFIRDSGLQAWKSLMYASAVMAVMAAALFAASKTKKAVYAVAAIVLAESLIFAFHHKKITDLKDVGLSREIRGFLNEHRQDDRILWLGPRLDNYAAADGFSCMWGECFGDKRFCEFMYFTQGYPVEQASTFVELRNYNPLYKMLRCGHVVGWGSTVPTQPLPLVFESGKYRVYKAEETLPEAFLVDRWRVVNGRDAIFAAMKDSSFDPAREAVLEEDVNFAEGAPSRVGVPGDVKVESALPGRFVVSARLSQGALLVMSERYDAGWRARDARRGVSAARKYRVIPANYVLLAVPLEAGDHRLTIEYAAPGFALGVFASLASAAILAIVAVIARKKRKIPGKQGRT